MKSGWKRQVKSSRQSNNAQQVPEFLEGFPQCGVVCVWGGGGGVTSISLAAGKSQSTAVYTPHACMCTNTGNTLHYRMELRHYKKDEYTRTQYWGATDSSNNDKNVQLWE